MSNVTRSVQEAYDRAERFHSPEVAYPQLNLSVYFVGSCFIGGAIQLFAKAGCKNARTIKEADLVVFLGGADVNPELYGQKALGCTYYSDAADKRDMDAFTEAATQGIPMFGICRGMQFLAAMNGNKLYQDVRNHTSTHNIIDNDGQIIRASSMHHQMVVENDSTFALAYAEEQGHGHTYADAVKTTSDPAHNDLEAAVFPDIDSIAVQGHPEVGGYPEYSAWCLQQIKDFLEERMSMGGNSKTFYTITDKGKQIDPAVVPPSITKEA